jgi:signal transduction histidine kinase
VSGIELPDDAPAPAGDSARVSEAQVRAQERVERQRGVLRPLGWAVMAVVVAGTLSGDPAPSLHGEGAAVTLALLLFVLALGYAIRPRFSELGVAAQTTVIGAMGASSVVLIALQPKGATELAGGAAVWMAIARLPLRIGIAVGVAVTLGLNLAAALGGASATTLLAITLLCALLGVMAHFMRQARANQDNAELLVAQLQDAREEQTQAAAVAERGRIASELHDVLAHALSGAAVQLQGARMLAERESAGSELRAAIERASALVKDGLADARQAVGALRGNELPGVADLPRLIDGIREDMGLDVAFDVDGAARPLPSDAQLAIYRAVQEALTNVGRHAAGARTSVLLRYENDLVRLSVEDRAPVAAGAGAPRGVLDEVGGGRGLEGMRERVERAGGQLRAGPTEHGWRVELELPVRGPRAASSG